MNDIERSLVISAVLAAVPFGATRAEQVRFDRPFAPAAHGWVQESERPFREEICLNGRWDFQAVPVPAGFVRNAGKPPELPDPSPSAWDAVPIKIPSPWNVNAFQKYPDKIPNGADYRYYPSYPEVWEKVEMAWMRRKFVVPKEWAGRDIRLHFEAVAGECEVRVNGKFLKRNFNLNLPFDVEVSGAVRLGEENEVLVGVRRDTLFYHQGVGGYRALPSNTFWGWECAGIWQDVSLVALPKTHIADVFVQPLRTQKAASATRHLSNSREIFLGLVEIVRLLDESHIDSLIEKRDYEALEFLIIQSLMGARLASETSSGTNTVA